MAPGLGSGAMGRRARSRPDRPAAPREAARPRRGRGRPAPRARLGRGAPGPRLRPPAPRVGGGAGGGGVRGPPPEPLGRASRGCVFGGPPIAVRCECGEKDDVRYGDVWTWERSGRRWDTNQIPPEDYDAIRRTQLRFRVLPVVLGVLVLALAIFFSLTGNVFNVFLLLPVALLGWFVFLRPVHRRRYRQAIADLPRWELHPE